MNLDNCKTLGYIYKITSPKNSTYIGQAVNITKRKARYKCLDCKSQQLICRSISKYGWDNHTFEILYIFDRSLENIDQLEIFYIEKFNSYYYDNKLGGLNLTKGGKDYAHLKNKEFINKVQKSRKGYKPTEETKEKQRQSHKGQISWAKDQKFTKEHVAKIIATKRATGGFDNMKCSEEKKKKHSIAMTGKIFDENWRSNIRKSAKNRKSQGGNRKIVSYNSDGTIFKNFNSIKEASLFLGFNANSQEIRKKGLKSNLLYKDKYWKYENTNN